MKGIIIAGGLGTRLRPLTYHRPKPLMPVVNRPFLEYQVALLRHHGINDIVFATNYMAEMIQAHFGDGSSFGVKMRYAVEETPLGTGGAIRNAADLFPGEAVAVFNGDVLTDFDLSAILEFHRDHKALATITLQPVPSPNPFGVLILNAEGRVREWREPSEAAKKAISQGQALEQTGTDLINAGFYVLEPQIIARIPQGKPSSVERDIYPALLAEQAPIYGVAPGGFWMDLGRPEQLMAATEAILSGAVKTHTDDRAVADPEGIAADAVIEGHTSLGKGVRIEAGAHLKNCILLDYVTVGKKAVLQNVILDEGARVEEDVLVEGRPGGSTPVIAAGSVLKQGTRMSS